MSTFRAKLPDPNPSVIYLVLFLWNWIDWISDRSIHPIYAAIDICFMSVFGVALLVVTFLKNWFD